ncbi:MAG: hypothetical protein ACYSU1_06820 [Planctomycetota bacterium]|jgi:YHS domain-containing protein
MKPISILMAAVLFAVPAVAQHDHGGEGHGQQSEETPPKMTMPTTLVAQTTCPISGEELEDKDTYVDYEGHRIYVCCKKCKKKTTADPERVAFAMYADGIALENIQTTCAVSGEELEDRDTFVKLYNKTIFTCCKKCKKKVAANPAEYLDLMDGRSAQKKCAVRGGDIDPEANFLIEGMTIGQCCPGCEKKWEADPAAYFAKLEADKVVLEPMNMTCPVMPGMDGNKRFPVTLGAKRYYLCSEKAALMFVMNQERYMPGWYAAQGFEMPATPASHDEAEGHDGGHGDRGGHGGHGTR